MREEISDRALATKRTLRRSSLGIALAAVALGAVLTAWPLLRGLGRPHGCRDCNVVLVSIDSLRADHLGCYGYPRPTTPHIDAFAADAVRFVNAIAQASSTTYSHASMLTALIPRHHGASGAQRSPIRSYAVTLPQILTAEGWLSVSFNGGGMLAGDLGFARGFAVYDSAHDQTLAERAAAALAWLARDRARPFFLFLHSYEVHHPYVPEGRFLDLLDGGYDGPLPRKISVDLLKAINAGLVPATAADIGHVVAAYDAELRSADEGFGSLIARLKERGLYDRTLIVLTGDHGEEFGEHGAVGWHTHSLYDELLRVPLLVKFPRSWRRGETVERQVSHVDLLPTILDVLDLPASGPFDGRSLVEEIENPPHRERLVVSQRDTGSRPLTSIRSRRWKLLFRERDDERLLFDLRSDPGETVDVYSSHTAIAVELRAAYEAMQAAQRSVIHPMRLPLEEKVREQLRALGYDEAAEAEH